MGSESEPAKLLLPFLQRADELQKHEPLVAYYCRLYAMEKGLNIPQKDRTKTTNSLLVSLMNQLEKDKKSVKLGPEDNLYIEGFASNVFAKADKQDRAGRADLNTAKTFYAASIFFEILSQFGELQPDIEQKQKYAIWKAADIRKALKEGRRPEPGPPGGEKELPPASSSPKSLDELGHSSSFSSSQPPAATPPRHVEQELGHSDSFSSSQPPAATPPRHVEQDLRRSESFTNNYPSNNSSPQLPDHVNSFSASPPPPLHPSYQHSNNDYPQGEHYHRQIPPSNNVPENPSYSQHYHSQSFSNDHQNPPMYQENPNNNNNNNAIPPPPYSYPNFQSYPSFHDTTLPAAPTHSPSFYQHSNSSSSFQPSGPSIASYTNYDANNSESVMNNHIVTAPQAPVPAPAAAVVATPSYSYTYDSNYQPPVEKITEAHKAARFAVGALAFDDVPVAVEFLRKSLELLTNPNAETH